jgi:hypothetical protein
MHSASDIHRETLSMHHTHMAGLISHRSCFCCFMSTPEKVLVCGHALSDCCVKIFGQRSSTGNYTHVLPTCVLCGVNYKPSRFRLIPPTAGIRMLSVDGGGIRGIVPLKFLQYLDRSLVWLHTQIRDHFDFVCGTCAGESGLEKLPFTAYTFKRWTGRHWYVLAQLEHVRVHQGV